MKDESSSIGATPITVEGWASYIVQAYETAVESSLKSYRTLAAAKTATPHGAWLPFCASLGIDCFRAAKMLKIAESEWIFRKENFRYLPMDSEILYVLSQVNFYTLDKAREAGLIRPDMTRAAAIRIRDGA